MRTNRRLSIGGAVAAAWLAASPAPAQVTADRLVNASREPQQWLTYSGSYDGARHTALDQINRTNVQRLALQWVFQTGVQGWHETTPLVIDGVMYLTAPQNHAYAIDVRSGRPLWHYERNLPKNVSLCCGPQNRGLAALGDRVFMGTLDAHVVALDAKTGRVRWDVAAAEAGEGYSFTGAPLAVKDKVIVGVAGGEYGVRGFIDAYDAESGRRAWRFYTIPGEGEQGNDTWKGDSWKRGGSPAWVTGSYDPDLNTLYWGTGNPGPQMYGANRTGDNLYSDSLVALDPDTGRLKWHFQFTPHDVHDWDSTHTPILFDGTIAGRPRKLVAVANRNGFFYVLDRVTGSFVIGRPYTQVTWAKELDAHGRPLVLPNTDPTPEGTRVCPSGTGGTNWHQPSYSPQTRLVYFFSKEACDTFMADEKLEPPHRPGRPFIGSAFFAVPDEHDEAAVRAVDPTTGTIKWEFREFSGAWAGVFSTAGGLVFSGDGQGNFIALDAETGKDLWHVPLGADVHSAAISYGVDRRQFITIAAGGALFTFALPDGAAPGTPAPAGAR
jgi:alcohol dehydrogenase (cytochrome c)